MPSTVYLVTKNNTANAAILVALAIYLGAVIWQGNLGAFLSTAWADFSGQGGAQRPAFWQWFLALVILLWLAENDTTSGLFAPLLAIVVIAMLIELATTQPQLFANLNQGIAKLFGGT